MNLFNIAAALTLNSTDYEKGLESAEKKTSHFGEAISAGLKTAGVAVAAVGAAVTAVGTAFYKEIGATAEYGDNIDKMSQKIGLSAEAFQEWDFILQHSGANVEALKPIMKSLTAAVSTNADAFERLGITQEQAASMSREDLFAATVTALQNITDETERAALAQKTLGRGAQELGALLNTSAEDTEAMRQSVHDLGGVMSDEAVKNAAAYQDQMQDLGVAVSGLKRGLVAEFMPAISQVFSGLTKIFTGKGGINEIKNGISDFANNLLKKIPELMPVVTEVIKAMGDAAIASLPILVDSLMSLITSLTKSLVDSLPLLIDTVLTVVEKIANSLGTDILPVLLPSITEAVVLVAETLVEHLPTLLSAALTIVTGIAEGLLESMPILLDKLPIILAGIITFLVQSMPMIEEAGAQLLGSLMDNMPAILNMLAKAMPKLIQGIILGLMEHYPEMLQGGSDLLMALVEVIPEIISAFLLAIPEFFDAVVASFNEALPDIKRMAYENSDKVVQIFLDMLNNAKEWGKDLLENFISGIKSKFDKLKGTVKSAAQTVKDFLGFSEPKEGPLSDFHKYAPDMIDLFVKGLHDNIPKLNDAFEEILLPVQDGETYGISGAKGGVTMNIYASKMTPAEVFEESRIQLERMALMNV